MAPPLQVTCRFINSTRTNLKRIPGYATVSMSFRLVIFVKTRNLSGELDNSSFEPEPVS
ncbi:hypothetical protein HanIR_Chr13g0654351 [Helianthus annuus]|nr:hypothetical protein HanIR_Chr13g0654351 [Helianthus annuus]